MLEAIGLKSAEELFDSIPQDLLLQRPLNTPAALSEIELLNRFEQMGAAQCRGERTELSRRRRLFPLHPDDRRSHSFALRVFHCIHAVPTGDFAGHAANDLRVSNTRVPVDGDGSRERVDVRRFDSARRSGADGGACDATIESDRIGCRASAVSRSRQDLRAARRHRSRARVDFDRETGQTAQRRWRMPSTIKQRRSWSSRQTSSVVSRILQHSRTRRMRKARCWSLRSPKRCRSDC